MKFLGLIRAYIAGGDILPDQRAGCPSGQHPALWMGGMPPPAPAGTSSQIKNSRRGPQGTSRPLDGREVPGPTPPAQSAGGRYPFFKNFPTGTPFPNFIFYPFLKKNSQKNTLVPVQSPEQVNDIFDLKKAKHHLSLSPSPLFVKQTMISYLLIGILIEIRMNQSES
jgi:hypothetical protein